MKIIIALDSFKGTLTATQACNIVADAVKHVTNADIVVKPMADGGEGTAEAMVAAKGGSWIPQKVMGPLPEMEITAGFGWFEDEKEAIVEMAKASGIEHLTKEQLDPYKTTTYGTGQLIKAAMGHGARKIILAVGGSATVDGGVGAAMALGWEFLDENENSIPLGGMGLSKLEKIVKPNSLNLPSVEILSDVDNLLCGDFGAAKIYGPQKGATSDMVEQLEKNLSHLSCVVKSQFGKDINNIPGAGAAGGLAAGAIAFMDAKLVSGIEAVIIENNLEQEMEDADWVITGEGSFDSQSLMGKTVSGIVKIAQKTNTKIAVIAGQVSVQEEVYKKHGILTAVSCKKENISLDEAIENCKMYLFDAAIELSEKHIR
ncbi:MAG: glycerate kinase [Planctomycetota bacterium]